MKKQSFKRKLSIILILCSLSTAILSAIFVNITMNTTFDKYMKVNQEKREKSIVEYFKEVYLINKGFDKNSGIEMMHEAYMNNYCLTLLNKNKEIIWGMNPKDVDSFQKMHDQIKGSEGVYSSKTFKIVVDKQIVGYIDIGQYSPILLTTQDKNFKKSINEGIVMGILVALIIVIWISINVSRQFSIPIRKVADMSIELSKGNYETRTDIESNVAEIVNLNSSMNLLGEKLNAIDTARKRLLTELSHELRTPLNILQNNLEAMIDGIVPADKDKLNNLNDEVVRFGKLLNNLDSLKKLEEDNYKLELKELDLKELINSVYKDYYEMCKSKNVSLSFNTDLEKMTIVGDEHKLRQVFINLISNGLKFNKNNGNIIITSEYVNNAFKIQIRDSGMGIKKEDLPFIFERLYRADKSSNVIEGSGVGLAIVKSIMELHGAQIKVESEENVGSMFTLIFKAKGA